MAGAIRMVSLSRGHDPRDFALFAFGGAGPLHAVALARELGIPEVLVPARPGLTNALGCLVADLRQDFVKTLNTPLDDARHGRGARASSPTQRERGMRHQRRRSRARSSRRIVLHAADMQFRGQTHLIRVALPARRRRRARSCRRCSRRPISTRFQVRLPEIRAVLVNLVTSVIGRRPRLPDRRAARRRRRAARRRTPSSPSAAVRRRALARRRRCSTARTLPLGARIAGPAVVQQIDATTVIEPGAAATVDAIGNLRIAVGAAAHDARIDPITLAVIQAGLGQVCNEMDIAFSRSAFSPVIAEADDRSVGIYDRDDRRADRAGRVRACRSSSAPCSIRRAELDPPDRRGQGRRAGARRHLHRQRSLSRRHAPDGRALRAAVLLRGRAVLLAAEHRPLAGHRRHGAGRLLGHATEVEQEGLRLPPVKLFKRGVMDAEIFAIITSNIRIADQRIGDIRAQAAALKVGERRLTELIDRYGARHGGGGHRRDPRRAPRG